MPTKRQVNRPAPRTQRPCSRPAHDTRFGSSKDARTTGVPCRNLIPQVPSRTGMWKPRQLPFSQFRGHLHARHTHFYRNQSVDRGSVGDGPEYFTPKSCDTRLRNGVAVACRAGPQPASTRVSGPHEQRRSANSTDLGQRALIVTRLVRQGRGFRSCKQGDGKLSAPWSALRQPVSSCD